MAKTQEFIAAKHEFEPGGATEAIRWTGVLVLAVMFAAAPLALGSVQWWAWGALWALAALALVITLALWLVEGRAALVAAPVVAIPALLAVVAAAQLARIPSWMLSAGGGRAAEIHRILSVADHGHISLEPGGTLEALIKASIILMAAVSALALPRSRGMLAALAGAVIAAAVVSSAVGIIQENGTSEKIYGLVSLADASSDKPYHSTALDPVLSSGVSQMSAVQVASATFFIRSVTVGDVFGPYANSNHFGGLVAIALPTLFAVLLGLMETRREVWREEGGLLGSTEGNLALMSVAGLVVGLAAAVYALSYGAIGGLAVGFAGVALITVVRRRRFIVAGAVTAGSILAGLATLYVTVPGLGAFVKASVGEKLAGREEIWRSTARAALDFPILGTGLGTFAAVIPHYGLTEDKCLFAHNDYLQLVLEVGIPVALALAAIAVWQFSALVKGAGSKQDAYCAALSSGAAGSVAALAFHSLVDFNLHVPANALAITAIACVGAVAARAVRVDSETLGFTQRVIAAGRVKIAVLAFVVLAIIACGGAILAGTAGAEAFKADARALVAGVKTPLANEAPDGLAEMIARVDRVRLYAPFDAEVRYAGSMLAALGAHYQRDAASAALLQRQSASLAASAARLSPAHTYYSLTAATLGDKGNGAWEKWPSSSFAYEALVADMKFAEGRDDDGLIWMKKAFALASGGSESTPEAAKSAVARLAARFGGYERIAATAPDTFAGHLMFARSLVAANLDAGAAEEFALAAKKAFARPDAPGVSERTAAEVALALAGYGRKAEAFSLYETALQRHAGWQYLRLEYADALSADGRRAEAETQLGIILSSPAEEWLMKRAQAIRDRKSRR